MSTAKQLPEPAATPPGDAKLISAARRGENEAFEALLGRHHDAAMRLARRLAPNAAAEVYEVAADAAADGLRAGTGPRSAFRPYLLTAVRRANYERAKAAGKVRPIDELAATKVLLIASSSIGAELLGQTTLAYRELSEVQQLALWHTEVDGEPFLDTGLLLGLAGTEVAELAFGARDELRRAMVGAQLDAAASGPCRWTCDRLGAYVRRRLSPTISEKVRSHLEHCSTCRELVPAVTAMEAEMQILIAMVVLGAAAGPYLDMDSVPAKGRRAAVVAAADDVAAAGFFHGRRKAALAGVGAIVAAAGLFGGLSMASNSGSENAASGGNGPAAQLPGAFDDFEAGPDDIGAPIAAGAGSAGSDRAGSAGSDRAGSDRAGSDRAGSGGGERAGSAGSTAKSGPKHAKTYTGESEILPDAAAARSAPKHAKSTSKSEGGAAGNAGKKSSAPQQPNSTPADNGEQTIVLGPLGALELTPNAGLLGILPKIELIPPTT